MSVFTLEFWIGLWNDFIQFFQELPIAILEGILGAFAFVVESIPIPSELVNNGLGTILSSSALSDIHYFIYMSGMDAAFGVLAIGFGFRMLRKVVTLFQW